MKAGSISSEWKHPVYSKERGKIGKMESGEDPQRAENTNWLVIPGVLGLVQYKTNQMGSVLIE